MTYAGIARPLFLAIGILLISWSSNAASVLTDAHRVLQGDYYELTDDVLHPRVRTGTISLDFYYNTNLSNISATIHPVYANSIEYTPYPLYQDKYYANLTFSLDSNSQMPNLLQTITNIPIISLNVWDQESANDFFIIWGVRQINNTPFVFELRFEGPSSSLSSAELLPILLGQRDELLQSQDSFLHVSPYGYPHGTGWQGWGASLTSVGPVISVVPITPTSWLLLLGALILFAQRTLITRNDAFVRRP